MSGDIFTLALGDEAEDAEYKAGYDDGYNGRGMKQQTTVYGEGYADGVEDREDGWRYSLPVQGSDDWGW